VPWIILRFALIGPVVGCVVFTFLSHIGPGLTERMPVGSRALGVGDTFLESTVAGVYGVIFTYPMTGSLGAIAGLLYWFLLKRRRAGNWSRSGRLLVGGFVGLVCALAFGVFLFDSRNVRGSLWALLFWAVAGVAGGASSAVSVGKALYEVILPIKTT
jgi:hypothetical protein